MMDSASSQQDYVSSKHPVGKPLAASEDVDKITTMVQSSQEVHERREGRIVTNHYGLPREANEDIIIHRVAKENGAYDAQVEDEKYVSGETRILGQKSEDDGCTIRSSSKDVEVGPAGISQYSKNLSTRNYLLIGLALTWAAELVCIVISILIFINTGLGKTLTGAKNILPTLDAYGASHLSKGTLTTSLPKNLSALQDILPFTVSVAVTLCNEGLGLIHAVCLRWALLRDGRSAFNSNLRLLSHSTSCVTNSWYSNIIFGLCVSLTYCGGEALFQTNQKQIFDEFTGDLQIKDLGTTISGISLVLICIGLGGQLVLATSSFVLMRKQIPTWSSNAINNSLACLHLGIFQRQAARSMRPYDPSKSCDVGAIRPSKSQPNLWRSMLVSRKILTSIVIFFIFTLLFNLIVFVIGLTSSQTVSGFGLEGGEGVGFIVHLPMSPPWASQLAALIIIMSFQLYLTFALHCVELLVNAVRDEKNWRRASVEKTLKGARIEENSVIAAIKSPETVSLFLTKSLCHWAFLTSLGAGVGLGDGLIEEGDVFIAITSRPLWIVSGLMLIVAYFSSRAVHNEPQGPQPSAFGHYQTLIDLIDVWPGERDRIFWGDKSRQLEQDLEVRRAGTDVDASRLGLIVMDAEYL